MVLDLNIRERSSLVNHLVLPFQSMLTLLVNCEVFVHVEQVVDGLVVTLLHQIDLSHIGPLWYAVILTTGILFSIFARACWWCP